MVGTRGQGSKSKSKGLSPVPVEPVPLNILPADDPLCGGEEKNSDFPFQPVPLNIRTEDFADDPLYGEGEKDEISAREVTPMEEEEKYEEPILSGGLEEEQVAVEVNDNGVDFAIEMDDIIHGTTEYLLTNEEEEGIMEEVSAGGDAGTNLNTEINNEIINEEDPEEVEELDCPDDEAAHAGGEQRTSEAAANGVPKNNEGLATFKHGAVGSMVENPEINTISTPPDREGEESVSIERNANSALEVKAVTKKVNQPKKMKRKLVKRKMGPGVGVTAHLQPLEGNGGSGESSMAGTSNDVANNNEGLGAFEHGVVESTVENLEPNKQVKELNAEESISTLADREGEESIERNASSAVEVKAVAENNNQPKKTRRKLIKKKLGPGKVVTAQQQPLDGISESGESSKAATSNDAKLQPLAINEASVEASKEGKTEIVENEVKAKVKPVGKVTKKLNRLRRNKLPQGNSGVEADGVKKNLEPTKDKVDTIESKENNQTTEQKNTNENAEKSEDQVTRLAKRNKKNVVKESSQKVNKKDMDKPGSSKKGKLSKRVDSMGMIFMCSSGTKKDCFRYKVLGQPAGKKDIVSKIYKGMRLFLFDVDLRMLYGIYKAAGAGGYNLEPGAFKSQFPSQVRFTIFEDCLPLAEEKFKKVIKDNYYTKKKFNCQLTSEQVKNLCKLFHDTTRKSKSKRDVGIQRAVASSSAGRDRKRKRVEDSQRMIPVSISSLERERSSRRTMPVPYSSLERERSSRRVIPASYSSLEHERSSRRAQEEARRAPVATDDRYREPVVFYDREIYLPPVASATVYQPLRAEDPPRTSSYSYERAPVVETYTRDYRDLGLSSSRELRYPVERSHHDPYVLYREPVPHARHEPEYDVETRREPVPHARREPEYDVDTRREPYNYSSEGRYAEYYRPAEYRPPLPLYRRY